MFLINWDIFQILNLSKTYNMASVVKSREVNAVDIHCGLIFERLRTCFLSLKLLNAELVSVTSV